MNSKKMHAQAEARSEKMKREEAWEARVRAAEARLQVVNDQKPTPLISEELAKALDERTLEARAHERAMVAYSAYLALSKFQEVGLHPAEKAYREAYGYAMEREP